MSHDTLYGIYLGVLVAVGVYHLLLWLRLREPDLLAYAAYVATLTFRGAISAGIVMVGAAREGGALAFMLLAISSYVFFRSFLDLPAQLPRVDRFLRATVVVAVAGESLALFTHADWLVDAVLAVSLAALFAVAYAAIALWRGGSRPARWFVIAFAGLLAGSIVTVLRLFAMIPSTMGTQMAFEAGTSFEALALALGIADRIRRANEERDRVQAHRLEEQRTLTAAYARFVPTAFLDFLGKERIVDVALGDCYECEMTVLFSDVRGFTSLSEQMSPQENFDFINAYLERVGPVVREHGGVIDKYIGDAVMALFRIPQRALDAALAMQRAIAAFNEERAGRGEFTIAAGIGLHTGTLMLGTIGEHERMDGTVIGDAVNLASRIEGLTKRYGVGILITDETYRRLPNVRSRASRFLGAVRVKGKADEIGLFEMFDAEAPDVRAARSASEDAFNAALALFQSGKFNEAAHAFAAIALADPDDLPARLFAERATALGEAIDPQTWDGVETLDAK